MGLGFRKGCVKLFLLLAFWVLFSLFLSACSFLPPLLEGPSLYSLKKLPDSASFALHIRGYERPKGVLPDSFVPAVREQAIEGDFVYASASYFHEFFVFDHRRAAFLFSLNPISFIEIRSPLFYQHCLEEFAQIQAGKWGRRKLILTSHFLKTVGNLYAEVYFSPKEINYSLSGGSSQNQGRIRQTGPQRPPLDLWRLFAAAQKVRAYFPDHGDQRLHSDIGEQTAEGKDRTLFTSHFDLGPELNHNPPAYLKLLGEKEGGDFAYVHGEDLELTEDLLGNTSINFIDTRFLLKDFLFLFSLSPNKETDAEGLGEGKPALNYRDALVLLLRADKEGLRPFLTFIEGLMQNKKTEAIEQPPLLISEIGNAKNYKTENDYILLHNPNPFPLSLTGLYLGRDSSCNLENGWSEYKPLPPRLMEAHSYFLISREGNTLGADWVWSGPIGQEYCVTLSASLSPPPDLRSPQSLDSFHFRDLTEGSSYVRKGSCKEEKSDDPNNDLSKENDSSLPENQASPSCF